MHIDEAMQIVRDKNQPLSYGEVLLEEINRLRALEDQVPKTKDGVPVLCGMKVYCYDPTGYLQGHDVGLIAYTDSSIPTLVNLFWGQCYSTQEAAWKDKNA
jgi:hypothetical protein